MNTIAKNIRVIEMYKQMEKMIKKEIDKFKNESFSSYHALNHFIT